MGFNPDVDVLKGCLYLSGESKKIILVVYWFL